ncbi:fumarylacetoacetate hydrolase family protein [Actinomycetospora flava]|uniref:Fumarylacetoacetate hydrolase family protein n=1 Tax=Actinomycetospora flava TaxID=3129232 RepID=A0ABU8M519_9PSEU
MVDDISPCEPDRHCRAAGKGPTMRLANIRVDGRTRAARADGDTLVVLEDELTDLLRRPGWQDLALTSNGARVPVAGASFAPLVTTPDKIICAGLNYKAHIAETGRPTPEHPFFFSKFPAALIGAHDELRLPTVSEQTDWEVELTVVIGEPVRDVDESGARAAIAGYTIMNDVTVRDWQHHGPTWLAGKTFEATTPLGPYLVTPDEFPPGEIDLELTCSVNGERMQKSRTSDLLFGVPVLISYMSRVLTLLPGDVIATGTPSGIGGRMTPPRFLEPGDVLTTAIPGIGELQNVCR